VGKVQRRKYLRRCRECDALFYTHSKYGVYCIVCINRHAQTSGYWWVKNTEVLNIRFEDTKPISKEELKKLENDIN